MVAKVKVIKTYPCKEDRPDMYLETRIYTFKCTHCRLKTKTEDEWLAMKLMCYTCYREEIFMGMRWLTQRG